MYSRYVKAIQGYVWRFGDVYEEKNIDIDVFDDVFQNAKHRANDVNRPPQGGVGEGVTPSTFFQPNFTRALHHLKVDCAH